jgi:hypothetical protein
MPSPNPCSEGGRERRSFDNNWWSTGFKINKPDDLVLKTAPELIEFAGDQFEAGSEGDGALTIMGWDLVATKRLNRKLNR